jgi:DNA-directed RNA polymerase
MDTLAKRILYERQVELEERMSSRGISRYRKNLEQSLPSNNSSGISLMKKTVGVVEQGIIDYLKDTLQGNAGRGNRATNAKLLNMVAPDVSAYLALKTTIDHMSLNPALTATAMRIAGFLEDEFKFDLFKKQEPKLYGAVKHQVSKRTSNRHYMRYNLIHTMNKHALITYEPWSRTEKLHVGCKLLDIIVRTTGLIEKGKIGQGRRSKLIIQPTKGALDWVTEVNRNGESLSPAYAPCIIPPKEWTSVYSGGYWSEHIRPLPLVKTTNRCILEEFDNHDMPLEYKAINALQNTGWRINTPIVTVVEQIWDRGGSWAGLPSRDSLPIPTCPLPKDLAKEDMSVMQAEQFKMWKRRASVVYNKNAKMASKRLSLIRTLQMAKEYKEELYFPYQNDYRARKYAVSSFLNPQGTDYSKALIHFSKGKPIATEQAFHWLCVQGANTFGNDKVTFDQRQLWVEENEEAILKSATDPLGYPWWAEAGDPFQFLAFCYEYAGFKREGWGYISHLPIALDGRNNGLQHLSALGLDAVGGKATCLVPSDTPEDIYQMVYEKLWAKVEDDADNPMAQMWLAFGASRKTVKRPIMVIPYGGSRFSCSEYIQDYINEQIDEGQEDVFGDEQFKAVLYLSNLLWDAANQAVPAARKIMSYLQEVGKVLSKENLPVIWKTPTDFWVHQMYPDTVARRITTHIDGVLIKPQLRIDNFKAIDKRRAINGVSPNFVHSMDASAMTLTICKAVDEGISSFAMIHDSYGVHASDTELMGRLIRESFVEIYRTDRLTEFANHAREVLGDAVPHPPEKGTLDIEQVLESKYFFA